MQTIVKLLSTEQLTPDTHRYEMEKPDGLEFTPGQAVELAIDEDGWRDEGRPFTMTSHPEEDHLEFVIKSYPDHEGGVTRRLPELEKGQDFLLQGPFGAIADEGPGIFLAAGAGITPFIPILKRRGALGEIGDCVLFYANKTQDDIILRETWETMPGLRCVFAVENAETAADVVEGRIDAQLLTDQLASKPVRAYLCGPHGFVDAMREACGEIGLSEADLVVEDGW